MRHIRYFITFDALGARHTLFCKLLRVALILGLPSSRDLTEQGLVMVFAIMTAREGFLRRRCLHGQLHSGILAGVDHTPIVVVCNLSRASSSFPAMGRSARGSSPRSFRCYPARACFTSFRCLCL